MKWTGGIVQFKFVAQPVVLLYWGGSRSLSACQNKSSQLQTSSSTGGGGGGLSTISMRFLRTTQTFIILPFTSLYVCSSSPMSNCSLTVTHNRTCGNLTVSLDSIRPNTMNVNLMNCVPLRVSLIAASSFHCRDQAWTNYRAHEAFFFFLNPDFQTKYINK